MYLAKNETAAPVAVRDDAGKHVVEPGGQLVLTGDQHAAAAAAAGLTVAWVTEMPAEPAAAPAEPEAEAKKPVRKASVKAREK